MVSQLRKSAGSNIISFNPEFLVGILEIIVNVCKSLIEILIDFNNHNNSNHAKLVSNALPEKMSSRMKKIKKEIAMSFGKFFFFPE